MDRTTLKLIASGKYLDLNKSYNQEQHAQFIEGALFTFDLITAKNRLKRENDAEKELSKQTTQDVYTGPIS